MCVTVFTMQVPLTHKLSALLPVTTSNNTLSLLFFLYALYVLKNITIFEINVYGFD